MRAADLMKPVLDAQGNQLEDIRQDNNSKLCWICGVKVIDCVLLPSGKACTCMGCGEIIAKNNVEFLAGNDRKRGTNLCPITNTPVEKAV